MSPIEEIDGEVGLDRFLDSAGDRPAWLFKHSLTCGTSSWALDRFRDFVASRPQGEEASYAVIPVQTARGASNTLAAATGVRHESPQVLLMVAGRVVWHESHWRITVEALEKAAAGAAEAAARIEG